MHQLKTLLSSRRRLVFLALVLLLLLDLGRSLYARVGYAQPVEVWQPDLRKYADLTWPPGSDLPSNAPTGQRIYAQHCQVCHGPDGRGNGPAAPSLIPRPRNFALGQFKYKTTPSDQPPTDEDLIAVVRDGLDASAMPYWGDLLTGSEIRQVVTYIKTFSPVFNGPSPQSIPIPPRVTPDAGSIARGKELYAAQGCVNCHGPEARGGLVLKDAEGHPVISRDLTAPWTFRGNRGPRQIWMRITTGLAPGPMPPFMDKTTPEQRWDLVNYILSLARPAPWDPGGKLGGPGQIADLDKRGEYLVHAEMCGLCHTQINRSGIYRDDAYLAGGMRVEAYPHGVLVSPNLTSDPQTGLGNWSEAQIVNALTNGRVPDRVLSLFDMPWIFFHNFSQEDAQAIARYLKTALPPVHNEIPAPLRYGLLETILAKLPRPAPAFSPTFLTYGDGNWGSRDGGLSRDLPQTLLIGGQWAVLVLGIVAFVFGPPREHRFPRRVRGWILAILALLGLALVWLFGSLLYDLPQVNVIPPGVVARPMPTPNLANATTPEKTALVERGAYIYTIASCALCHGENGRGGAKISWRPMGTIWARNISPDPETGIGNWGDAQIARAIRSGVSRDGYPLHWQGMIWDHLSNWDEEDIRAVITYLRSLPPVKNRVPADRPPAPDDCAVYTFWLTAASAYGCE